MEITWVPWMDGQVCWLLLTWDKMSTCVLCWSVSISLLPRPRLFNYLNFSLLATNGSPLQNGKPFILQSVVGGFCWFITCYISLRVASLCFIYSKIGETFLELLEAAVEQGLFIFRDICVPGFFSHLSGFIVRDSDSFDTQVFLGPESCLSFLHHFCLWPSFVPAVVPTHWTQYGTEQMPGYLLRNPFSGHFTITCIFLFVPWIQVWMCTFAVFVL